jgi:hypothetical protein
MENQGVLSTFLVIILALFSACEQVMPEFNPKGSGSKIVIEGMVTDSLGQQVVKISRSSDYLRPSRPEPVTNALVVISSQEVGVDTLVHQGDGVYLSDLWKGKPGSIYRLRVEVGGLVYEASEQMPVLVGFEIDSVVHRFDEIAEKDYLSYGFEDKRKIKAGDSIFRAYFYAKESKSSVNFYLFDFKRNSSFYRTQTDIIVADDELIADYIQGLELPGEFYRNDTATAIMYGISRQAYRYYRDLENVMNSDGGMFSPPAGNPLNNLSNGALGYFQVCAVRQQSIIVR